MTVHSRIPTATSAVRTRAVARRGFLLCALFSLAIVAGASPAYADQPIPMAVLDTFTRSSATPPPGYEVSFEGVFTSIIGTEVVSGTSRMDVHFVTTDIVHCKFTWVSPVGTIVVHSVCVLSNGHGAWHVHRGTGRYEHFKAVGTETFGSLAPGGSYTMFERFAGIVTDEKDGDENEKHGRNQ